MGRYINQNSKGEAAPIKGKADFLINDGAREIETPEVFEENLVCVVENPNSFDAALYVETQPHLMMTLDKRDTRKKRFLIYDHVETTAD